MGMDQYVWAVENSTGDEFPLRQWRKFYALENAVEEVTGINTDDCVIRVELHQLMIVQIINNLKNKAKLGNLYGTHNNAIDIFAFLEYLLYHMDQYSDVDYNSEHTIVTPKYTYYYGADW